MGNKSYTFRRQFRQWTVTKGVMSAVNTFTRLRLYQRIGVNNPKWKAQVRAMMNASTTLSVTHFDVKMTGPRASVAYTVREPPSWHPYRTYDEANGLYDYFDNAEVTSHYGAASSNAETKATSSLFRALNNAHHQFQGGVFVGEGRKTAKMIVGAAGNFRKNVLGYLSSAKKIRKRGGKNVQGNIQNAYLEATFGWSPLIKDIDDGAQALARYVTGFESVRFRGFGQDLRQIAQIPGSISYIVLFRTNEVRSLESIVVYYGAFKIKMDGGDIVPQLQRIISLSGFDLRSFIPTVWELIPYSFLVDYFLNVGEVLEACNVDRDSIAWLTKVTRLTSKAFTTIAYVGPSAAQKTFYNSNGVNSNAVFQGTSGHCDRNITTISRSKSELPYLLPRFKIAEVSGKQFLNIAALFSR